MPPHEDNDKMLGSCPDFAVFHRGIRANSGAARRRQTATARGGLAGTCSGALPAARTAAAAATGDSSAAGRSTAAATGVAR